MASLTSRLSGTYAKQTSRRESRSSTYTRSSTRSHLSQRRHSRQSSIVPRRISSPMPAPSHPPPQLPLPLPPNIEIISIVSTRTKSISDHNSIEIGRIPQKQKLKATKRSNRIGSFFSKIRRSSAVRFPTSRSTPSSDPPPSHLQMGRMAPHGSYHNPLVDSTDELPFASVISLR